MKEVFPGKIHGHCAQHFKANVKIEFGKAAADFFGYCVYASTEKRLYIFSFSGH